MDALDLFSRTFLPAAAEAGVAIPTVSRHIPILRRCVGPRDTTVLVAQCSRPDHPLGGGRFHLLVLTRRRLVVTAESHLLRRLRLHLNSALHHLADVTWTPEPTLGGVQLSATAIDGVREHFWVRATDPEHVHHMDGVLRHLFRDARATVTAAAAAASAKMPAVAASASASASAKMPAASASASASASAKMPAAATPAASAPLVVVADAMAVATG